MPSTPVATTVGHPVEGFPLRFEWQTEGWPAIFDEPRYGVSGQLAGFFGGCQIPLGSTHRSGPKGYAL